jgi:hypothetical protein
MKFLCVPCDRPMKLLETGGPDDGSMRLTYGCEACGYEFAMLTNAHETQVVGSLGVTVGPDGSAETSDSKCPFTGMVRDRAESAAQVPEDVRWTSAAQERLQSIPSFIRPMAKDGIEKFARDKGYAEVDEGVLEEARSYFGM